MRFLIGLLKVSSLLVLSGIIGGRLFAPQLMQDVVISPVRNVPIAGQVLGVVWDKSGEIAPALTKKTVQIADHVESSDLGINEAMEKAARDNNLSTTVSQAIEQSISLQVSQLKGLPKEVVDKTEQQIRNEVYRQVCSGWLETNHQSSQSAIAQ